MMELFGIQFIICNVFIVFFILFIICIKKILKKYLSQRIQYILWFSLLLILIIPFVRFPISQHSLSFPINNHTTTYFSDVMVNNEMMINQINDYAISIDTHFLESIDHIFMIIWIFGMIILSMISLKFYIHLYYIQRSALPLENKRVKTIYQKCLKHMNIQKEIPVYTTIFLKTPILIGVIRPRIYLPMYLVSDYQENQLRYIFLHELNHYLYKDCFINSLMNMARIVYWFNYIVFVALKEMSAEREIACDESTLNILNEQEHRDYGYALFDLQKKITTSSFPFINSLLRNKKEMMRRMVSIMQHQKQSLKNRIIGIMACCIVIGILFSFIPVLSIYTDDTYEMSSNANVINVDYSNQFNGYDGSFVLYDSYNDDWYIYNQNSAKKRFSPNLTYKIYSALLGLEKGVISKKNSTMKWDHDEFLFKEWQKDHDLYSAMTYSVNWYFQNIDQFIGFYDIHLFLEKMHYGNQRTSHDLKMYWNDSSLKISPIEQVELLKRMNTLNLGFSKENIQTVKKSILLYSSHGISVYGKTGTGRVNNQDINGWFIGFIEINDHSFYFATHIRGKSLADGSTAKEMTLSILKEYDLIRSH